MPQLIKGNQLLEDEWLLLKVLPQDEPVPEGKIIVPLHAWESRRAELEEKDALGIWLDSDEQPDRISADLACFSVVAINFPAFTDGRGYSSARLLRERYHYRGELRAIGDVLRDQLYFMKRCGFDSYALRDDFDAASCLDNLADFSESYQAAYDQPLPLFRRRHG